MEKLWLVFKCLDGVVVDSLLLSEKFVDGRPDDTGMTVVKIEGN